MYYFYMGTMQLPIPPASMRTRVRNKNKTISLINKGEINILKNPGLTEVSFKVLLPNQDYPFNQSILDGSQRASYYIDQFEQLKAEKEPFQFIVVRMTDGGSLLNMNNVKMTLEDYSLEEDAKEGYDFYVDVELKQYKEWGSKKIEVKTDKDGNVTGTVTQTRSTTGHDIPESIVAKKGDTLQTVCKKYLGSASLQNMAVVKKLNKIVVPAMLAVGQKYSIKSKEMTDNGSLILH